MRININITKTRFFAILGAFLLLAGSIFVYAYNSADSAVIGNPVIFGHSTDEVDWSRPINATVTADDFVVKGLKDWMIYNRNSETALFFSGSTPSGIGDIGWGSGWRVIGMYDFDGNGVSDVFWQHQTLDYFAMWYMQRTADGLSVSITRCQVLYSGTTWNNCAGRPTTVDTVAVPSYAAKRVVSINDFDRDGEPDLLLQVTSVSGGAEIWYGSHDGTKSTPNSNSDTYKYKLSGSTPVLITSNPVSSNYWYLTGAGNLDGDLQLELVWQGIGSEVVYWDINEAGSDHRTVSVAGSGYFPSVPYNVWKIGGILDFDSDGQTDFLWYSPSGGLVAYWHLVGKTYGYSEYLLNAATLAPISYAGIGSQNWVLRGMAYINSDDVPDILWEGQTSVGAWYLTRTTDAPQDHRIWFIPKSTTSPEWDPSKSIYFTSDGNVCSLAKAKCLV